tara:strand:+ start:940 stop:2691 length:1752 start_codon:yes stop_codon:yes gene_type:complete
MNDNLRYLLAGVLIFIIILLQPIYLDWLGLNTPTETSFAPDDPSEKISERSYVPPVLENNTENNYNNIKNNTPEHLITFVSPLYTTTISNRSGGTIKNHTLTEINEGRYKYGGGYDDDAFYNQNLPVSLLYPDGEDYCHPCLSIYNNNEYELLDDFFTLNSNFSHGDTVLLNLEDQVSLHYSLTDSNNEVSISKTVTLFGNSFSSIHNYSINKKYFNSPVNVELLWSGGLRPSEEIEAEDVQYGSAIVNQAGEQDDIQITSPDKVIQRSIYHGTTDWVAIRTKYFLMGMIPENPGSFSMLSGKNISFGSRKTTPSYNAAIGFPFDTYNLSARVYLGPLDIDHIKNLYNNTGKNLDSVMNFGWTIIQPISKGILWVLKYLHNTLGLNYGLALLIFALIVRVITGPLTKKSFESSHKMQKLQPLIKKMQAKHKENPQKLNQEMMQMYKTHGVNPLGGCLPMLIQMPLLMALFIVFRSTIEFRGEAFVFWITDLSKPDVVIDLPFTLPLYGSGIAILPLIMGVTLFLTMQMTSATMDKTQKPVMYIMNGFFILLFNSFPSGLNLYYTAYNILSYAQQRKIRKNNTA